MNQTVEQYLQAYINYKQNDWVSYLAIAQYTYNNTENEKTKITPFFVNYGYNPSISEPKLKESLSLSATESAKRLKGLHQQLKEDAEFINLLIGKYYDRKHKDMPY